jgi:hypothetical protein
MFSTADQPACWERPNPISDWLSPVRQTLLRVFISQTVDGGRSIAAMGPWGETLALGLMLLELGGAVMVAVLVFQLASVLRRPRNGSRGHKHAPATMHAVDMDDAH